MKTRILMSVLAVLTATAAFAVQSVFSVFPNAGGDLASATDWGDVPKPTASDHLKINKSGTYTLGEIVGTDPTKALKTCVFWDLVHIFEMIF